MALTLSDYKSRVRDYIDVSSSNQLSDAHLEFCIKGEIRELVQQLHFMGYGFLTNLQTVDLSSSGNYTDLDRGGIKTGLPTNFGSIISLQYRSSEYTGGERVKIISPHEYKEVESAGSGSGSALHNSRFVATVQGNANDSYQYLYVYPDPEGVGKLEIRYYWIPTEMSEDGDESGLPAYFDDAIILGASARTTIKGLDLERYQMLVAERDRNRKILLNNVSRM